MARFKALQAWRKEVGARRGVDPDVIVSNSVLWALAEQNPKAPESLAHIEGLGPWKIESYGSELLRILRRK